MTLYPYLRQLYKDGEPIFAEDIQIKGLSRTNLSHQLQTLVKKGAVAKYQDGIYYFPKVSKYGFNISLSPDQVAYSKYIERNQKVFGFYSGHTFANLIGVSSQVPIINEIVSNAVSAVVRDIAIGKQQYTVRHPRIMITPQNVKILQLLEFLKDMGRYSELSSCESQPIIQDYVKKNNIKKHDVDLFIRKFPDSTFRYYYEMRLDDVLT